MPNFPSARIFTLLKRALFSATTLVGASALCASTFFLLRYQSTFEHQFELRAETLAGSLAGQGQFSLLVGDRNELQQMANVALAGNPDVLYIAVEDAAGQTVATALRAGIAPAGLPAGPGQAESCVARYLAIRGKAAVRCVEAAAPVIAQAGLYNLHAAKATRLGRIRIGLSLQAGRGLFLSTVRYVIAIAALLVLVACLIEYSRSRQRQASEKIRAIEDRMRFLVSFSPSVLYSCAATREAPVTFIGDNVRQLLGHEPADYAQPGFFWDHLHPEDEPRVRANLAKLLAAGQYNGEYRLLDGSGAYRWIQNHARIVYDAGGAPQEIVGSLFDITEKMQAQEALRESELRYRELTEMLPQTVFECDVRGRLIMANQTGMTAFGVSRQEVEAGICILDLVVPEDRARAAQNLAKTALGVGQSSHEYVARRRDGSTFPVVVYGNPILCDGQPAGVRGLLIDISERRRAEEALRDWAMLLESSHDAIVKRAGNEIVFWNSGAERIYGYSAGEMLGHSIEELTPEERRHEIRELTARLERGETVANFETERIRKDGARIDISLALTPVRDSEGRLAGMVGNSRDITELKRKQRELQKQNALLELLQGSAVASNQAATIEEAIQSCLDRICAHTGWQVGHAFLASADPDPVLISAGCWHLDEPAKFEHFRQAFEGMRIGRGLGLAGRVFESGAPYWVADLDRDPSILPGPMAIGLGLQSAFASPILAGSEVVGVLEFFSTGAPEADERFLQAITSIGVQLGRVIERARAGEALKESETRYRAITEYATHGILTIDERGRILFANQTSGALFGRSSGDLLGMEVRRLMPTLPWELLFSEPAALSGTFSLPPFELLGLDPGGQEMPLEISISGYLAKDGRPVCTAILRDVSERNCALQALESAHQAVRAVIENSPLAIVTLDHAGRVQSWNRAAERMFGWPGEVVLGHALPCLPASVASQTEERLASVLSGETLAFETRRLRQDGSMVEVEVWAGPIRGVDDSVTGVVVMYADLSERKMLEAQLRQAQKLESIGQLAAGLAHEINTPIQYVGDNLRFLQQEFEGLAPLLESYDGLVRAAAGNPAAGHLVDDAQRAAQQADIPYLCEEIPKALLQSLEGVGRVAEIVKAMKEFSHPGTVERTATNLNRAIESTVLVCRNEWKYVADLETDLDPGLPPVPCLAGEINQVILNLVINAAQAIGEAVKDTGGHGKITVSTRRDGSWIEVRVRDTGTGIPEKIRDRVFDPFFTTKEVGKGSGQGLAIAHSVIVKKHAGSISFETETGAGTVFIIRLPLAEGEKPPASPGCSEATMESGIEPDVALRIPPQTILR